MKIKWKWVWIFWLVAVLILSLMPVSPSMQPRIITFKHLDKLVHVVMYLILSFTMLKFLTEVKLPHAIWYVLLFCILWGIGMEYIQSTRLINRNFDIADIIANIIGTFAGIIIFKYT